LDPIYIALGGVISALATALWRTLLKQIEYERQRADFWQHKALTYIGAADLALDEAEKRDGP
jgi:hypothetical protein